MSEILLEKYLASQFKFGFELEAFLNDGWSDYGSTDYDDEDEENIRDYLNELISDEFGLPYKEIEIKGDGSLRPSDDEDYPFEWATPTMTFTPQNLKRCIRGLNRLINNRGIYTNDSCGFHVHLSFPDMSDTDIIWIISQLAVDQEFLSRLTYFKGIEFLDEEYANIDFIENIGDYIKSGMYSYVARYFTTEKYRAFHIHSQGTLEWRGPRNFLNKRELQTIKDFFKLLHDFVTWISKATVAKSINGVSKENYFKLVFGENHNMGDTIIKNFSTKKSKEAQEKINFVVKNDKYMTLVNLLQKYNKNRTPKFEKLINTFLDLLTNYTFYNSDMFLAKTIDELYRQKDEDCLGIVLGKIGRTYQMKTVLLNCEYETYEYLFKLMYSVMPEEMLQFMKQSMASYYSQKEYYNKMVKFLENNKDIFSIDEWQSVFANYKILCKYSQLIDKAEMINEDSLRYNISKVLEDSVNSERYMDNRDLYQSYDVNWIMTNNVIGVAKNHMVLFSVVESVLKDIINRLRDNELEKNMKNEANLLLQKLYNN